MDTHKNQFRQISILERELHPNERAAYRQRMREQELKGRRVLEERVEELRRKFEPDHEPDPWELDLDCDFELAMSALAPLTRRQYRSAWKQFDAWRGGRPVDDRNLAQYCWNRFKTPVYRNGQKRDLGGAPGTRPREAGKTPGRLASRNHLPKRRLSLESPSCIRGLCHVGQGPSLRPPGRFPEDPEKIAVSDTRDPDTSSRSSRECGTLNPTSVN